MDLQLLKIHELKYVETVKDGDQIEAHLIIRRKIYFVKWIRELMTSI